MFTTTPPQGTLRAEITSLLGSAACSARYAARLLNAPVAILRDEMERMAREGLLSAKIVAGQTVYRVRHG